MGRTCERCHSNVLDGRSCPVCMLAEGLRAETVLCRQCQAETDTGARFCAQCGAAAPSPSGSEDDAIRAALDAKLANQYRILRQLGRGGMGRVYLARDLTLEREVAIKVISTEDHSREVVDRFRREARTAAKLSHPNIVPLHAFGEVEGLPYFVMGYVRGESLADRMRRDGALPEDEAVRTIAEIADALDHAHREGVVHRDVKPDNVLLEDASGRALLTDFGVAKALGNAEAMTGTGSVVGTPHFMSPEQAAGRADIDGRSDIYSLGVMAYSMLAGRLPFEGTSTPEILAKHLTQAPPPLRTITTSVSDPVARAVERCLAKEAADRWPDARSLARALGAAEESRLPDALRAVEGKGLPAVLITLALMMLYVFMGLAPLWFIEPWLAVFFVAGYLFIVARLRGEGFSVAESQVAIWREPAWWLWWYPRALRRRGNVWDRLPPPVRRVRGSVLAFTLLLCGIYLDITLSRVVFGQAEPRLLFGSGPLFDMRGASPHLQNVRALVSLGVLAAIVTAWLAFTIRSRRLLGAKGLNEADVSRVMLTIPPGRAGFWARPHIDAVLAPAGSAASSRHPETPHDQLQTIIRDADALSGALRPIGSEAAVAGRHLLASIEHIEREMGVLPPHLARVEEARQERDRQARILKTLAQHVTSLRTRSSDTPAEIRIMSERVRSLCRDIADRDGGASPDAMATVPKM